MGKMTCFFILYLCFLVLTDAGPEALNLHDSDPRLLKSLAHTGTSVSVSVSNEDTVLVASSVLMAENWVRTTVLAYFPATKITTIVVGHSVLCNRNQEQKWNLILPAMKNLYFSLVRWGLEKEIKVSAALSTDCLVVTRFSSRFRGDLGEKLIKPLLNFLQSSNSTYAINPAPNFPPFSADLVSSHEVSIKKLGFLQIKNLSLISNKKPINRKLTVLRSNLVDPFPTRPTPLPNTPPSPLHSSIATIVNPASPLSQIANPPGNFFSFAPDVVIPGNPPDFSPEIGGLPPCSAAAPPERAGKQQLWCVAKPTVPASTLQEAIDYACGEGGAECDAIMPSGSCYYPDSLVAHASYAFNSYWQKNKINGGTCNFGGTAMIISSDPSFERCHFLLN